MMAAEPGGSVGDYPDSVSHFRGGGQEQDRETDTSSPNNLARQWIARAILRGGVAYLASRTGSPSQGYSPSTYQSLDGETGYGVELANRPVVGERDAPVDMYYWMDYLCPFCKEFETQTLPKIGRNYIESGDVRLVFLSYPNIGQYSRPSAHWDRCVWRLNAESEPSTYWHWHGEAFDAQSDGGHDRADSRSWGLVTQRYAYDLVVTHGPGSTYDGDGTDPEEFHCFGLPIVAPADGTVVATRCDQPDHDRIGWVDLDQRSIVGNDVQKTRLADRAVTHQAEHR
jgi:hypothetical protein